MPNTTTRRAARVSHIQRSAREHKRATAELLGADLLAIANGGNPFVDLQVEPTARELAAAYLEDLARGRPLVVGSYQPVRVLVAVDAVPVRLRGRTGGCRYESIVSLIPDPTDQVGLVHFAAATIVEWGVEVRRCDHPRCRRFFYRSADHRHHCSAACMRAKKAADQAAGLRVRA